jgi:hypothetical protein
MPITHLPVIPTPNEKFWKEPVAAPRTWAIAVEKVRKKQIELKGRAAAEKIAGTDLQQLRERLERYPKGSTTGP